MVSVITAALGKLTILTRCIVDIIHFAIECLEGCANDLQKAGGIAAAIEALAYLAGFALFLFFLDPSGHVGPVRKVAFLVESQATIYFGLLVTYVLTGTALVVLGIALH